MVTRSCNAWSKASDCATPMPALTSTAVDFAPQKLGVKLPKGGETNTLQPTLPCVCSQLATPPLRVRLTAILNTDSPGFDMMVNDRAGAVSSSLVGRKRKLTYCPGVKSTHTL
mmetsp:Transcript_50610/g.118215  ORF Transcript_50610/g.118215 Transcript_50610/m.118215 type:complete len:113 (-) Transcript_50610:903-1241(-)